MPAEVLFLGGKQDSFEVGGGTPVDITSGSNFNATWADSALRCSNSAAFVYANFCTETVGVLSATTVVTGETLWFHCEMYVEALLSATVNTIEFLDGSNQPWLALRKVTTDWGLYYNSGTGGSPTWTLIGSLYALGSNSLHQLDIRLTLGSPHTAELYVSGVLVRSGTFTQASLTTLSKIKLSGGSGTNPACEWSQVAITRDIPLPGARVKYFRPTANGANTAWSGVFTDVNEAVANDTTVATSASAGQKESHAMGDVTLSAGVKLKCIFHWMRAKNDGVSPVNIKSLLRISATDYSTGNLSGVGTGFSNVGARYPLNPATAAEWTDTAWNATEAGFESAA